MQPPSPIDPKDCKHALEHSAPVPALNLHVKAGTSLGTSGFGGFLASFLEVSTLHKFIYIILDAFGFINEVTDLLRSSDSLIKEFLEYYDQGLLTKKDIDETVKTNF